MEEHAFGGAASEAVGGAPSQWWLQRALRSAREDRAARAWLTALALLLPALWIFNVAARKRLARAEAERARLDALAVSLAAERAVARAAALAADRPSAADAAAAAAAARAAERAASAKRAQQAERERHEGLRRRADAAQAGLDASVARSTAALTPPGRASKAPPPADPHAAARAAAVRALQARQDATPPPPATITPTRTPPSTRAPREPLPSPGPLRPSSPPPRLAAQRRLVSEQDAAFAASLAADAAREAAAARAREAAEREAARLEALRQRWAAAAEPPPDAPGATPLLLRYPDGVRVSRRMPADATVHDLYDAAEALRPAGDAPKRPGGVSIAAPLFALLAGFPPRELPARGSAEARATQLRAAGVDAGSSVLVVLRSTDGT